MTHRMDEARAMRVMVSALREEDAPQHDWDAVEQRLSVRLDEVERVSRLHAPVRIASPLRMALPLVAAAAAIVLGIGLGGTSAPAPAVGASRHVAPASVALASGEAGGRGDHDLSALRAGDVVETGDAAATFSQAGSLRWSIAPHSRVVIKTQARAPGLAESEGGHVVALEQGSLRAEVAPRDPSLGLIEAFAVEVGGTRVAVHGTAFSVSRGPGGIVVDVEHGAVAVGPVGHVGATSGHLLVGPSRAACSLDGGRTARNLPRPLAVAAEREPDPTEAPPRDDEPSGAPPGASVSARAAGTPARSPVAARGAEPEASAGAAPSVADAAAPEAAAPTLPTLTLGGVRAGLHRCFAQAYGGAGAALGLSVRSTLTVTLRDDGSVQSARFDPPMKPEFLACSGGVLGGRFGEGPRTLSLPVAFGP